MHKLWQFHGGLKLPEHKAESMAAALQSCPVAPQLILPVQQHIGEAAHPIVEVGERVLKGQVLAQAEGYVSAPVHASSSGTVVAIEPRAVPHPSGMPAECIVIETDGEDEWIETEHHENDYAELEPSALRNFIREAGIVGLGGAGFPSFIKLNPGTQKKVHTLILNGAECEPYISCDAKLMQTRPREVLDGLVIMRHALHAEHCLIGIEDNKPQAIAAMEAALSDEERRFVEVVSIPTVYPAGGEKQLIKTLTGVEVPTHQLPIQVGVVCHNVGTAAAVARAVKQGEPLISRLVTVTGKAVDRPGNYETLIGTPIDFVLEHAGLDRQRLQRPIMGGPMMGFELLDLHAPLIKTTNCLLAADASEVSEPPTPLPCIRCGECARVCPAQLLPQQMYWFAAAKDFDKVQDYNLFDCIECGCCAQVCPSHIPLVQYYRFAKTEIWEKEREKHKADIARDRHEFHQYRIERKKKEDEERKKRKKEMLKKAGAGTDKAEGKQDAIQQAVQRARSKKKKTAAAKKTDKDQQDAQA